MLPLADIWTVGNIMGILFFTVITILAIWVIVLIARAPKKK